MRHPHAILLVLGAAFGMALIVLVTSSSLFGYHFRESVRRIRRRGPPHPR